MCRSGSHNGEARRCKQDPAKIIQRNGHRRTRHALVVAKKIIDDVLETPNGERWLGELTINLSHPLVAKAFAIAVKSHKGTDRINGEPYINHPLRVAKRLQDNGFNEEVVVVALLHDAVEDSALTLGGLRRFGFNERIVSGVDSVTKRAGEDYPDAVKRASKHPIGRLVKLSDNLDNSSESQIEPLSPERQARAIAKYTPARLIILNAIMSNPAEELYAEASGFHGTYKIRPQNIGSEIFA
jgi:(p)ppGpp synthase/HD superfamily hydrolase